jgi:hypothetical protein
MILSVFRVLGSAGAFWTPGSGIRDEKKSGSGSEMNIPDHIPESLETIFTILKFFDVDPDPGSGIWNIFNPGPLSGIEKFGSGIHIPDPQH